MEFIKLKMILFLIVFFLFQNSLYAQMDYNKDITPVWMKYNCFSCHGVSGGFSIKTYKHLMTTGYHKPLVVPFDTNSILIQKLKGTASFGFQMPFGGPYLTKTEIDTITHWIKEGAKEPSSTSISFNPAELKSISLKQNYPNPFNPSTRIQFDIFQPTQISLKIVDHSGKVVDELFYNRLEPGTYEKEWNAHNFASGMYYIQLKAGNYKEVRKILLLK